MGPIGMPEMVMIFVVALLCFGSKKLPELARGLGKAMGEFKKARDDFEREITHAVTHAETEVRTKEAVAKEPATAQYATAQYAPAQHANVEPVTVEPAHPAPSDS